MIELFIHGLPASAASFVMNFNLRPAKSLPSDDLESQSVSQKEILYEQLRSTSMFKSVENILRKLGKMTSAEYQAKLIAILLLVCDSELWNCVDSEQARSRMQSMTDLNSLPAGLAREVQRLRLQLRQLSSCQAPDSQAMSCKDCSCAAKTGNVDGVPK